MSIAAVFQIGSLGDSIVSVPALLSIKELLPDCTEYLLISRFDSALNVLPNHVFEMAWNPKVQISFRGPKRGLKEFPSIVSLLRQLRYYRPRYCVYLMPSNRPQKQVQRDKLFFKMAGVKELVGFRALTSEELAPAQTPGVRDTESYLRLRRIWGGFADEKFARYSSAPLLTPSEAANQRIQSWLHGKRRHPNRRLVAVCPYSNYPSRDIPEQTLLDFLPSLEETGDAEIVIVGGQKDFVRAQRIIDRLGIGLNACGVFSLQESAALLNLCKLAICTESGPMHLASALGVPCLITFSRINQSLYRWFPFRQEHTVLYRELKCAGCRSINCPVEGHPCMRRITPDQILTGALSKLNGKLVAPGMFGDTRVACW